MKHELQCTNFDITDKQVQEACFLAAEHKLSIASFLPSQLRIAAPYFENVPTRLGAIVDFPYGNNPLEIKHHILLYCQRMGAKVCTVILNYEAVKSRKYGEMRKEIASCKELCDTHKMDFRVLLDYRLFDPDELADFTTFSKRLDTMDIVTSSGIVVDDPYDNMIWSNEFQKNTKHRMHIASNTWREKHIEQIQPSKTASLVIIHLNLFKNLFSGVL